MMEWHLIFARLVSMLLSWLQAGNLRTRMYILEDKIEIMRTSLEDIQRMDPEGRLGWYAKQTLDKIEGRE
jgi:hypothetical protein